jgi:hypothetical protein
MSESLAIITMKREAIAAQMELEDALNESLTARMAVLLERAAEHLARAIKAAKEAVR